MNTSPIVYGVMASLIAHAVVLAPSSTKPLPIHGTPECCTVILRIPQEPEEQPLAPPPKKPAPPQPLEEKPLPKPEEVKSEPQPPTQTKPQPKPTPQPPQESRISPEVIISYWSEVRKRIAKEWITPNGINRYRREHKVVLRIELSPQGDIASAICLGQPNPRVAKAALAAAHRAAPFPPPDFPFATANALKAELPIRLRIR